MRKQSYHARSGATRPPATAEHLESRRLLAAAPLADVNTVPAESAPGSLVEMNGVVYFAATDEIYGRELWRTDGTPAGTYRVKDITSGLGGASNPILLTRVGDQLYFATNQRLWRSDGTEAGTVGVAPGVSLNFNNVQFAHANGTVFVIAGANLWRTDGTEAGTRRISVPGSPTNLGNLTASGGLVYFTADGAGAGNELWRTDGTEAGTLNVKDIVPGTGGSAPAGLTDVNGTLFFSAADASGGRELYKSDGTAAGTVRVKDINPGAPGSTPMHLAALDATLYFAAFDPAGGTELWKSDGTEAGTVRVADVAPGVGGPVPERVTAAGGTLYFTAVGLGGRELWRTDGTPEGTSRVADIVPGGIGSFPRELTAAADGTLYFVATTADAGRELWRTDGTEAGTVRVTDIVPGAGDAAPADLRAAGSRLVFTAATATTGRELWSSDGTAAGTQLVADLFPGTFGSEPSRITAGRGGGELYFAAANTVLGRELWRSDGTAAGTTVLKDMTPGQFGNWPHGMTPIGQEVFFVYNDWLYKTDGTADGTVLLDGATEDPARVLRRPEHLANVDGTLFFAGRHGGAGDVELWKTDGTDAGTVRVKDVWPGPANSFPEELTDVNGTLFFRADSLQGNTSNTGLWRSDGTEEGTILLKSGLSDTGAGITEFGGLAYFVVPDYEDGPQLWRSDGTPEGTVPVTNIVPEGPFASLGSLTVSGDKLFFVSGDRTRGYELWCTDGTPLGPGTKRLATFTAWDDARLFKPTDLDGTLVCIVASDLGESLWTSDGTEAGTVRVRDLRLINDRNGRLSVSTAVVGGRLYFTAGGTSTGKELWATDGTGAGTFLYQDVYPGRLGSDPEELTYVDGILYFTANSPGTGREVMRLDPADPVVTGRHMFYNNSGFDDPAAGRGDDDGIATRKEALLPGGEGYSDNVTNYPKGINGVMVDVQGLTAGGTGLRASDLAFRVGPGGDPATWPAAPTPLLAVRPGAGAGGADRIVLTWPDGAIKNQWLQVTVPGGAKTGLAAADVFYFGNLAGDIDGSRTVDLGDFGLLRRDFGQTGRTINNGPSDLTRDGRVDLADFGALRQNFGRSLSPLSPPVSPAVAPTGTGTSDAAGIASSTPAARPPRKSKTATRAVLLGGEAE